jgi:hypothetical protein
MRKKCCAIIEYDCSDAITKHNSFEILVQFALVPLAYKNDLRKM